jgi:hypothetical protein
MQKSLDAAKARFKPRVISIIAPALPAPLQDCTPSPPDEYYRLDLAQLAIPQKTRNMLTRARREISANEGKFGKEHKKLIEEFLRAHRFGDATRFIFQRVPEYAKCDTARVFEARDARGNLVAFDLAEFGARQYAFYMFNFRSRKHNLPGASDLLLAQIIERAQAEGKRHINLGLGIDAGIAFFKRKWRATPFLQYVSCIQESKREKSWGFDKSDRITYPHSEGRSRELQSRFGRPAGGFGAKTAPRNTCTARKCRCDTTAILCGHRA